MIYFIIITITDIIYKEDIMIKEAKQIIQEANVIVVLAGAGMSADSGLPTFRGDNGFWNAYPKLRNKMNFARICTQHALKENPKIVWSLYGHMFDLFNSVTPHEGFTLLLSLLESKENYFVVTSNIDSHFQKAGFDKKKVYEIHGRINTFQCTHCNHMWKVHKNTSFNVDPNLMNIDEIPACPECGGLARPNIMMFNDLGFNMEETDKQAGRFDNFMNKYDKGKHKIALIEIGAGEDVPTIRIMGEFIQDKVVGATLIRVNPIDIDGPTKSIQIQMGALDAIKALI